MMSLPHKSPFVARWSEIFNKTCEGVYLENQNDIDCFVAALREELETAIKQAKQVRLR